MLSEVSTVIGILIAFVVASQTDLDKNRGDYEIYSQYKDLTPDGNSCEIGLRIYHSCNSMENKDFCIEEAQDLFTSNYYDKNKCTIFVGVPFLTETEQSVLAITIKALVSRCVYNVVLLNNSKHTFVYPWQYTDAIQNAYKDAQLFAAALNQALDQGLLRRDCVVGVGYSLAANTLGHVCRQLKYPCQVIYAIDPAGLLFSPPGPGVPPFAQLVSQQDACHVVYLLCTQAILGTKHHLGHVNIILNDGQNQPNCESGVLNQFIVGLDQYCSHNHCNKAFARAMASPGSCVARQCEVLEGFITSCDGPEYYLAIAPDIKFFQCGTRQPEIFSLETFSNATCKVHNP